MAAGEPFTAAGNDGSNISIDAASAVRAVGGAGGPGINPNGSGGGGAAIGGGGGGGTATGVALGGTLAVGSKGGDGGTDGAGGTGGAGALCGDGGGGGALGTTGTTGAPFDLGGNTFAQEGTHTVDLASRPNTSYAGYPALPTVTAPQAQRALVGGGASFAVTAGGGTGALMYQWQLSTSGGAGWADITNGGIYTGAQTATLNLAGVALGDSGNTYRCVVNDFVWREAASAAVALTVSTSVGASLNPATATFDKYASSAGYADVTTALALGSHTLTKITCGGADLTLGTEYTENAGVYTFGKAWLATLATGSHPIVFVMSGGANPTLALTVSDSTPAPAPAPTPGANVPQTGDSAHPVLWFGLGFFALLLAAILVVIRRRQLRQG